MWISVLCYHPGSLHIYSVELTWTVCLNRPDYEERLDYESGIEHANEEYNYASGLGAEDREFEYPFLALKKLLSDGSFYYSLDFNLTDRLQDRWAKPGPWLFNLTDTPSALKSRRLLISGLLMKICCGTHTWLALCFFSGATYHPLKGRALIHVRF